MLILWHGQEIYYVVNLISFFQTILKGMGLKWHCSRRQKNLSLYLCSRCGQNLIKQKLKRVLKSGQKVYQICNVPIFTQNVLQKVNVVSIIQTCKKWQMAQMPFTFFDCAEIWQHKHNKTKEYMLISADLRIFLESLDFVEIL